MISAGRGASWEGFSTAQFRTVPTREPTAPSCARRKSTSRVGPVWKKARWLWMLAAKSAMTWFRLVSQLRLNSSDASDFCHLRVHAGRTASAGR